MLPTVELEAKECKDFKALELNKKIFDKPTSILERKSAPPLFDKS